MKAVFDPEYIRRINGPNVKTKGSKMDKAQALMDDGTSSARPRGQPPGDDLVGPQKFSTGPRRCSTIETASKRGLYWRRS